MRDTANANAFHIESCVAPLSEPESPHRKNAPPPVSIATHRAIFANAYRTLPQHHPTELKEQVHGGQTQTTSATPSTRRAWDVAMDGRYKHLDGEERGVILAEHRRGASLREIGGLVGRAPSTIGRELRRGRAEGLPAQPYCAQRGAAEYRTRRKRCGRRRKLDPGGWLHDFVRGKLIHKHWSPEQMVRKLGG
ncbi:MAG: helix-turn-helix domain-containing protein, partial [Alphaproteobacteria bacterium]